MTNREIADALLQFREMKNPPCGLLNSIELAIAALCPVKHPMSRTPEPEETHTVGMGKYTLSYYWAWKHGTSIPVLLTYAYWPDTQIGVWNSGGLHYDGYTPVIAPEVTP